MVPLLTAATVVVPFFAGLVLMVTARRASASLAYRVLLATSVATMVCLAALLPHADSHAVLSLHWKPEAGEMGLAPGATSLWAALATVAALVIVLLYQMPDRGRLRVASGVTMLMALATANVAFLADHFLARYVALEVVALCVAVAVLADAQQSVHYRSAWTSYLLLRVGDAGLLAAIFVLLQGSGTLNIKLALEAGAALQGMPLACAVAGFVLAVWVKLGGWPFHVWSQPGRGLSLVSHAWLYATVMSNLGLYLLYRVTPLLALVRPLQEAAFWVGAGGAALDALLLLTHKDMRTALVYLGAVQAGLAVFAAASGVKSAIWLSVVLMTPLRVLLFLAADWSERGVTKWHRRSAGGLLALGGLALLLFNLLLTWWVREASAPLDALLVAEVGVAVSAVWVFRAARNLRSEHVADPDLQGGRIRLLAVGLVSSVVLAGAVKQEWAVGYLTASARVSELPVPGVSALMRHALTIPAVWAVMILAWGAWQFQRRSGHAPFLLPQVSVHARELEEGLSRAAQALHAVVEVGLLEQSITALVRVVTEGSRLIYRVVEQDGLGTLDVRFAQTLVEKARAWYRAVEVEGMDELQRRLARTIVDGASKLYHVMEGEGFEELLRRAAATVLSTVRVTYRVVEEEGAEELQRRAAQALVGGAQVAYRHVEEEGSAGILKPIAQGALAWARTLQRWQTGRLRLNLIWVVASLAVAVVVVGFVDW